MTTDLILYDPPKLLTEREVRVAGVVSNRRANLRAMLADNPSSSSLSVRTSRNTTEVMNLSANDTAALLALLLERDELFLTSLNIELEP